MVSALMHFTSWVCGSGEAWCFPFPLVLAGLMTAATLISSSSSVAVASPSTLALHAASEGAAEGAGEGV